MNAFLESTLTPHPSLCVLTQLFPDDVMIPVSYLNFSLKTHDDKCDQLPCLTCAVHTPWDVLRGPRLSLRPPGSGRPAQARGRPAGALRQSVPTPPPPGGVPGYIVPLLFRMCIA